MDSYVGLIGSRGLESFWPEHEHTARFLERRLRSDRHRSCCGYWAAVDEQAAHVVTLLLHAGWTQEAALALEFLAEHLGTIVPDTSDTNVGRLNSSER